MFSFFLSLCVCVCVHFWMFHAILSPFQILVKTFYPLPLPKILMFLIKHLGSISSLQPFIMKPTHKYPEVKQQVQFECGHWGLCSFAAILDLNKNSFLATPIEMSLL